MVINNTPANSDTWDWGVSRYRKGFTEEFSNEDIVYAKSFLTCDWFCTGTLIFLNRLLSGNLAEATKENLETYAAFVLMVSIDAMCGLWDRGIWVCPNSFRLRSAQRVLNVTRNVKLVVAYHLATEFEDFDIFEFGELPDLRKKEYIIETIGHLDDFYSSVAIPHPSKYAVENVGVFVICRYLQYASE